MSKNSQLVMNVYSGFMLNEIHPRKKAGNSLVKRYLISGITNAKTCNL